jgi:hypothetical protein
MKEQNQTHKYHVEREGICCLLDIDISETPSQIIYIAHRERKQSENFISVTHVDLTNIERC